MKDIILLGKKIIFDKSPVVFSYSPDSDWEKYWEIKSGNWSCEDGYLIGDEPGNFGGILFSKEYYSDNVMFSFTMEAVLPATRDLNAVFLTFADLTDGMSIKAVLNAILDMVQIFIQQQVYTNMYPVHKSE